MMNPDQERVERLASQPTPRQAFGVEGARPSEPEARLSDGAARGKKES
jgi:hypothetical protein